MLQSRVPTAWLRCSVPFKSAQVRTSFHCRIWFLSSFFGFVFLGCPSLSRFSQQKKWRRTKHQSFFWCLTWGHTSLRFDSGPLRTSHRTWSALICAAGTRFCAHLARLRPAAAAPSSRHVTVAAEATEAAPPYAAWTENGAPALSTSGQACFLASKSAIKRCGGFQCLTS